MAANAKTALDTGCGEPKWTQGDSRNLGSGNQPTINNCPYRTSLGSVNSYQKQSEWVPLSILSAPLAGCLSSLDQVSKHILSSAQVSTAKQPWNSIQTAIVITSQEVNSRDVSARGLPQERVVATVGEEKG